ncbi:hypothetical protein J4481_02425 [Candidatus Pacearchaeota archaeon]|nr:hypothetical protein [Candidatus Pacearchaeota archaeon]
MKLKKCTSCNSYTLQENCPKCKKQTKDAHYKFIKIKNAPNSDNFFSPKKSPP